MTLVHAAVERNTNIAMGPEPAKALVETWQIGNRSCCVAAHRL